MTTKAKRKIENKGTFDHELLQNKEQFGGYTVFEIEFAGGKVKMITLKDVKAILHKKNEKINNM